MSSEQNTNQRLHKDSPEEQHPFIKELPRGRGTSSINAHSMKMMTNFFGQYYEEESVPQTYGRREEWYLSNSNEPFHTLDQVDKRSEISASIQVVRFQPEKESVQEQPAHEIPVPGPPNNGYEKKESGTVDVAIFRSLFQSLYIKRPITKKRLKQGLNFFLRPYNLQGKMPAKPIRSLENLRRMYGFVRSGNVQPGIYPQWVPYEIRSELRGVFAYIIDANNRNALLQHLILTRVDAHHGSTLNSNAGPTGRRTELQKKALKTRPSKVRIAILDQLILELRNYI